MKDIVRHFESISKDKGFVYVYGTISSINLKMNLPTDQDGDGTDESENKIYMLAEPTRRSYNLSTGTNGRLSSIVYNGAVALVMKSTPATPYFSEQNTDPDKYDQDVADSKYSKHVEPILQMIPDIINYFICNSLTISFWEVVDWIDYTDENRDGILIRYTIQDEF